MASYWPDRWPYDWTIYEQDGGWRMTDRKTLVNDMAEMETLILDLEDVTPCGYSEKRCVLAICRCLWHILEYLIRRAK